MQSIAFKARRLLTELYWQRYLMKYSYRKSFCDFSLILVLEPRVGDNVLRLSEMRELKKVVLIWSSVVET